jgi:hypothetical protein
MPRELANADIITVLGNAAARQVRGFVEAAARLGRQTQVISYVEALDGRRQPSPGSLVRLDSPGACAETCREFLRAGMEPLRAAGGAPLSHQEIDQLPLARGAVIPSRQWFFGFRHVLQQLETQWRGGDPRWTSTPTAVVTAFDKTACLQRWAGLPTTRQYPPISSYAELRDRIRQRHARLFLKLRYGYSAMGALAIEWRDTLVRAITTVETSAATNPRGLFVSKRPQRLLRESEIAWLVDTLASEEVLVEEWLPKARWQGRPFDVRVVVIGGEPMHVVGRANASPFTNLNLDATRIDSQELRRRLGKHWHVMMDLCAAAAGRLPEAGMLGIDVLIKPCGKQFALLEANAFGDYLPGLMHDGMSTWDAELRWCGRRRESAA